LTDLANNHVADACDICQRNNVARQRFRLELIGGRFASYRERAILSADRVDDCRDEELTITAIILSLVVCAFAIPAWRSTIKYAPPTNRLRIALIIFTAAAAMQLLFIVLVWTGALSLHHSLTFAAFGVPACIVAAVLALMEFGKSRISMGVAVSCLLDLIMWLFLTTLH
jgi:hypothetical protein